MDIMDKPQNRLIHEKSPYLLQHSNDPVNWYPWCEEAFQKAKEEDKPIFLSIGYSTCHWCHIFQKESFKDNEVAEKLNRNYISIKVDREERPDIDSIYMEVCQSMTGSGGWPLTIFMTPDKKPFFAGTYFPKDNQYGRMGFLGLLDVIAERWITDKESLIETGEEIVEHIKEQVRGNENLSKENQVQDEIDNEVIYLAFEQYKGRFDEKYGGFGTQPKFPTPHNLMFLLRYYYEERDPKALEMVEQTLKAMYMGGIFDHIGYGFSRYSTDYKWHVPHFEKMLYDNALLIIAYIEAYQVTKNELYAQVAEEIITYVLRDMRSKEGGFYSAEDADSEGEEGKFYIWSWKEIEKVVGKKRSSLFERYYGLTSFGNIFIKEIPTHKDDIEMLKTIKNDLFRWRDMRVRPHLDDKILTSWNGLMIAALAIAGRVLKKDDYINAGEEAAFFILEKLVREDGRLFARYRDGDSGILAYLDDYAFFTWGLIELYHSTYKLEFLAKALELSEDMIKIFEDRENGGFYFYGSDGEQLIVRQKEIYDGALPSGNSVAIMNLLRLSKLTGDVEFEDVAGASLRYFYETVSTYPMGHSFYLSSLMYAMGESREVVLVAEESFNGKYEHFYKEPYCNLGVAKMINKLNHKFDPFTVSILLTPDSDINKVIQDVTEYKTINGEATAYICSGKTCLPPTTDVMKL